MSKIHLEILDTKRVNLLTKLSQVKRRGYLAGGTALALQIGHRRSVDFDIFMQKAVDTHLRRFIRKLFHVDHFLIDTSDMVTFVTIDTIPITFVWYYYSLLFKPVKTMYINLASVKDIAADKAMTIGRRAVWRDYVDIFYLIYENILTLEEIVDLAKKKFGGEFNEILFVQQLCYFQDFEIVPIDFIKKSFDPLYIQSFLEKEVVKYVKKV